MQILLNKFLQQFNKYYYFFVFNPRFCENNSLHSDKNLSKYFLNTLKQFNIMHNLNVHAKFAE